jgi:tetratricopeptide (TPR) repeat protein
LPPEGYKHDPKVAAAREKQLRAALAEPGYHLQERNQQTWELVLTLTMAGKPREAIEIWEPFVERRRSMRHYEGDLQGAADLYDLAELHHRVGEHAKAAAIFSERVAEFAEYFGPRSIHTGYARSRLVKSYMRAGENEKAIAEWEKLQLESSENDPGRKSIQVEVLQAYVGARKFDKLAELAEAYLAQARKSPAGDLSMRVTLAGIYIRGGAPEKGRALLEGELNELRKSKGADSPEVIARTAELARMCMVHGHHEIALELYRDAIAALEKKHGPDHEETLTFRNIVAWQLHNHQRSDRGLKMYLELVPRMKEKLGAGHTLTLTAAANLSLILESQGKFAEAEPIRKEVAEETARASKDPEALPVTTAQALLGANLLQQSKWQDAEKVLVKVLEIRMKKDPAAWTTFNAASLLGEALMNQKKYKEAEPLLLEGYQGLQKTLSQIPPLAYQRYFDSIRRLVQLYDQTDRRAEADKLRRLIPAPPVISAER